MWRGDRTAAGTGARVREARGGGRGAGQRPVPRPDPRGTGPRPPRPRRRQSRRQLTSASSPIDPALGMGRLLHPSPRRWLQTSSPWKPK